MRYSSSPGRVQLLDGPGEGKEFAVHRAPVYLRFVSGIKGEWDVLDLIKDEPTRFEEIHVYRQKSWVHIRADNRSDSGFHYIYLHVPITNEQKATFRYARRWREWANTH